MIEARPKLQYLVLSSPFLDSPFLGPVRTNQPRLSNGMGDLGLENGHRAQHQQTNNKQHPYLHRTQDSPR